MPSQDYMGADGRIDLEPAWELHEQVHEFIVIAFDKQVFGFIEIHGFITRRL